MSPKYSQTNTNRHSRGPKPNMYKFGDRSRGCDDLPH